MEKSYLIKQRKNSKSIKELVLDLQNLKGLCPFEQVGNKVDYKEISNQTYLLIVKGDFNELDVESTISYKNYSRIKEGGTPETMRDLT